MIWSMVLIQGRGREKSLAGKTGCIRRAKITRVAKEPNDLPRKAAIAQLVPVPQTDTGG